MPSVCIGTICWCCFVVALFRCSSHVPLFRGIPIVLPVFGCVFRQCSGVPVFLALQYAASDLDRPQEDIHQYRDQEGP